MRDRGEEGEKLPSPSFQVKITTSVIHITAHLLSLLWRPQWKTFCYFSLSRDENRAEIIPQFWLGSLLNFRALKGRRVFFAIGYWFSIKGAHVKPQYQTFITEPVVIVFVKYLGNPTRFSNSQSNRLLRWICENEEIVTHALRAEQNNFEVRSQSYVIMGGKVSLMCN